VHRRAPEIFGKIWACPLGRKGLINGYLCSFFSDRLRLGLKFWYWLSQLYDLVYS
jgi:hypothetical protein